MTTELQNQDVDTVSHRGVAQHCEEVSAGTRRERDLWTHSPRGIFIYKVKDSTTLPRVRSDGRAWVNETLKQLEELARLPADWDGEGSPPTDAAIVVAAEQLLTSLFGTVDENTPVPDVVPISGGGLQFEWTMGDKHLEIEFASSRQLYFLRAHESPRGPVIASGEYPVVDVSETRRLLKWLVRG